MTNAAVIVAALLIGADSPEYKLKVGPVEEDLAWAVVEAAGDFKEASSKAPILIAEGGISIPFAIIRDGDRSAVKWVIPEIKKGRSWSWMLAFIEKGEAPPGSVQVNKLAAGSVDVTVGGKPFTRLIQGEHKPYLWPILLDGVHLTRHYPMEEFPGEDKDHIHQRSFWFDHGSVNGVDFWAEDKTSGKIVQREVTAAETGFIGRVATKSDWIAPDGKKLLGDERVYNFVDLGPGGRTIDLVVTLTATEGPVTFGDTKEGTFGIRLAESMKETQGGKIVNSRGGAGMSGCWGKPAEWVDYTGKIDGKTYGVAIFDHPQSFRHPTTWHVRDYGLFAANPFGLKDFTGDKTKDGSHKLEKGKSVTFHYCVFFHPGTTEEAKVAAAYRAFAKPPEVKVERIR